MIEIKGNELGWLLNLAEKYYGSPQFREYIKKYKFQKLDNHIRLILLKFHPNNFSAGTSRQVWYLITKEELEQIKNEQIV